ncbi:hypothetical protein GCM10023149_04570 [Mucilaginibacter gynuensis]|uniref:4-alpha-glucanotransferase n=1 Tax=Mucilaginibacter gynuensis TaxID=1302236 RepID=A0ABP8FSH3_9SPHI
MFNPVATYRIQFHKGFTFNDLERIIPYLQKLGISTLYASPVFEATPGSTHGYDIVNPHRISPEIGTLKQLRALSKKLKAAGINWLQDIVPNHMAFHPNNAWLNDVLERGAMSAYANFFDMAGTSALFEGKIMVPFLGSSLADVIKKGDLQLAVANGRLSLSYFDSAYPLNPASYLSVLKAKRDKPDAIKQLIAIIEQVVKETEPGTYNQLWDEALSQLSAAHNDGSVTDYLDDSIQTINKDKPKLRKLADEQLYRLCSWAETDHTINFRRFFTVNGLICLNIQDEKVFEHYHQFIKSLLNEGVFQGLRVDHIDGLYDPTAYLNKLRQLVGPDVYIVIEKILEDGEQMPVNWPVQGTTGYEYLADVNNLFTNKDNEKIFSTYYDKLVGTNVPVQQQIWEKKAYILNHHMAGELDNLTRYFFDLKLAEGKELQGVPPELMKQAIGAFLVHCPVYRYYGNGFPLSKKEAKAVEAVLKQSVAHHPNLSPGIEVLKFVLLQKPTEGNAIFNNNVSQFYRRCMQLSGPLMAKGVEDTLMYTYNRFTGHNEVGDAPDAFGKLVKAFHETMEMGQRQWPLSLNSTSTHDTKRGEDVRARLNVLTDMADEWIAKVQEWQQINAGLKQNNAPDANDEYLIYQTLTGAYPMPGENSDDFTGRLVEYLEKALREAKQHSDWAKPDTAYEKATKNFAAALLNKDGAFWKSFEPFHKKVSDLGIINSLAQVLLKFTSPGVPDVYQGCERWDLSLVDPDNRRPVDYDLNKELLDDLQSTAHTGLPAQLWHQRYNAQIKLWLTQVLLKERKANPEHFAKASYIPLKVKGKYNKNILAFARRYQQQWYVVAAPLHIAELCKEQQKEIPQIDWANTRVVLPYDAPSNFEDLLTAAAGQTEGALAVKEIFTTLPLAILKLKQPANNRGAGILMSVTSLPSDFGVGDIGSTAKQFANFLSSAGQKYWQLLPVTPTGADNGYSPYSSFSGMAGNTLLISPEWLADVGLLSVKELDKYRLPSTSKVDYKKAEQLKTSLFHTAWSNFKTMGITALQQEFTDFCKKEAVWLDDFALYVELKQSYGGDTWNKWPEEYAGRDAKALKRFSRNHADNIDRHKWLQFLFFKQWHELKDHCAHLGISLFGDLPFYVSYDSADVWANPELFSLDEAGNMKMVAGVPPDYFNADGQLWGMPVFRWDKLKDQHYAWWVQRIRKNMELYDLLRLDHFRAFAAYWEVPATEQTAINGKWQPSPGSDFFHILKQQLGDLSFIAEDLGDIDDTVYQLRDEFDMPGMKVLQFAFGDNIAASPYIPHNYTSNFVVYTGTHDNNTTPGWYRKDAGKTAKKQLSQYVNFKVNKKNVHEALIRLAYSSVAKIAIVPIQDVLGLDETARMNVPASVTNNWQWRLQPGLLNKQEKKLYDWAKLFNRL